MDWNNWRLGLYTYIGERGQFVQLHRQKQILGGRRAIFSALENLNALNSFAFCGSGDDASAGMRSERGKPKTQETKSMRKKPFK